MSDEELLDLLRKDPQNGLSAVIGRYSAYVYKISWIKLNGICTNEDIEEAVSDIFFMFYQQGQKCGFEIRSLRPFLSLIAERHCINIFNNRIKQFETVSIEELSDTLADDISVNDSDTVTDAINSLGEPDTTIFVRKYFFGQKTNDIAKDLNMNPNTVDKRISRGLVKLRKLLKEEQ